MTVETLKTGKVRSGYLAWVQYT